jgi:ABC-type oligopeptide transport system ATPase subunit
LVSEAIAVRKLTKTYSARQGSVVALDDISFSIGEVEFVAIVGAKAYKVK